MRLLLLLLPLLLIPLLLAACAAEPVPPADPAPEAPAASPGSAAAEEEGFVAGTGTIVYQDLEGGFYGLIADADSARYNPINLEASFQEDGLRVRFEGRPADVMTVQMWGTPLELTRIERLEP